MASQKCFTPIALTRVAILHLVRKQNVAGDAIDLVVDVALANSTRIWSQSMLCHGDNVF
jgi:hypothetical protein